MEDETPKKGRDNDEECGFCGTTTCGGAPAAEAAATARAGAGIRPGNRDPAAGSLSDPSRRASGTQEAVPNAVP